MTQVGKWNVSEDPDLEVKGFRVGDWVQWNGAGPRMKICALLQLRDQPERWYAYVKTALGEEQNVGLEYIKHVELIERLGRVHGD